MKKAHLYKRSLDNEVHVHPKLLDKNASNRTGSQNPKYIVIHEVSLGTGKSPANFNMQHYANKIAEAGQSGRTIGYHYLVGDKEVYQFLEDDVSTDHTGTSFGNKNSIGVERLICKDVNYEQATHNQAQLIATLMLKHDIPLDNVITHKEIQKRFGSPSQQQSPKQCPGRVLAGFRGTVQDFKNEIKRCFEYGWFFNELLDEKTIKNIPNIQKEAQRRRQKEQQKKKTTTLHRLADLTDIDFENNVLNILQIKCTRINALDEKMQDNIEIHLIGLKDYQKKQEKSKVKILKEEYNYQDDLLFIGLKKKKGRRWTGNILKEEQVSYHIL